MIKNINNLKYNFVGCRYTDPCEVALFEMQQKGFNPQFCLLKKEDGTEVLGMYILTEGGANWFNLFLCIMEGVMFMCETINDSDRIYRSVRVENINQWRIP